MKHLKKQFLSLLFLLSVGFSTIQASVPPPCIEPSLSQFDHITSGIVCEGSSVTFTVIGDLFDATHWSIYTGSCGGTLVGTTTGSTFTTVPPAGSTYYYARGEGGCSTPAACFSSVVTTTNLDNPASISYNAATYCLPTSNPVATITGTLGGTFTSTSGLAITASTGDIDVLNSSAGSYTVTYTTGGWCPNISTASVSLNTLDDASFSYSAAAYCLFEMNPTPTITGLAGGTFSSTTGLVINASTGNINSTTSTPGTYTVTYTTNGTCPNSSSVSVTIVPRDDASYSYSAATFCTTDTDPTPTITGLAGGTFFAGPGLSISPLTGIIDVSASTPGNYAVEYATNGACPNSSITSIDITTCTAAPANDLCAGATPIMPSAQGTGCGVATFNLPFSIDGTTDSGVPTVCSAPGLDQWFTWTATSTALTFSSQSPGNPGIAVFANCADAALGIEISCLTTFSNSCLSGWNIGDHLLIQIYDLAVVGGTFDDVGFCLEESTPLPPPSNDDLSGAITVNCGSTTSGTTANATMGTDESGICGTSVSSAGIWYSITGTGANITASTCNAANYDTKINVYTGTSGNLTCVGGNDDGLGCSGFSSSYTFPTTVGTTYLILINGFNTAVGTFDLTITCENVWTGTTDTNWNTATNWAANYVPLAGDEILIPDVSTLSGNFPIMSTATSVADFTVATNASLTVNAGITLEGTFTNNGTVTLKDGAYLDDFTNTSSFVGNITVETATANGISNDQRFISSAVSTPPFAEIGDDLVGPWGLGAQGTDGVAVTVDDCATPTLTSSSNYGNLFEFNESLVASCALDGWVVRSSGSLENGRGYSAYLTNGSIFELTGTPNTGTISVPVTKGTSNVADGEGWNFIGNPYPSAISRDAVVAAGGANASYFVTTGVYQGSYTAYGVSSNIAIGQGFQVQVAATGTVDFTDAMRNTNAATWYQSDDWFTHKLEVSVLGTQYADKTTLFFNEDATNGYEPMFDVTKRTSNAGHPTLSTIGAGKNLTLNGLSVNDLGETVPMNLLSGANGAFTLSFEGLETFGNTTIYVKDLQENVIHNIANGDYSFIATTADNAARFEIIFVPEVTLATTKVDCEENEGSIEISNTNFVSERTYEIVENNTVIASNDLANLNESLTAGTYTVQVNDQYGGTQVYAIEIETAELIEADFTISNTELFVGEMLVLNNTTANSNTVDWTIDNTNITNVNNATYSFDEAGIYEIMMSVSNAECADTKTETITVLNKTTAIRTVDGETINFYPNPVSDVLYIEFNSEISVTIIDYIGKTVVETTEKTIDLSDVATGIYFLEVYDVNNKLIASEKIMKK